MNDHIRPADFFLEWEQFEMLNSIAGWMWWSFGLILLFAIVLIVCLGVYLYLTKRVSQIKEESR